MNTSNPINKAIFVMGVSGSGKSSIGQLLADAMSLPFVDADDHHPTANIDKMRSGVPLNDSDRTTWLIKLNQIAQDNLVPGCVIACSALKRSYRELLSQSISSQALWIYLKGSYEQIFERMMRREDHFMGAEMLKSQFETLEEPHQAIHIDISHSPEEILEIIKSHL